MRSLSKIYKDTNCTQKSFARASKAIYMSKVPAHLFRHLGHKLCSLPAANITLMLAHCNVQLSKAPVNYCRMLHLEMLLLLSK